MAPYPYTSMPAPLTPQDLVDAISLARFATYQAASGSQVEGLQQYAWNMAVSSAFHGPIHLLEVTLRNAVDVRLTRSIGPMWMQNPSVMRQGELAKVSEAVARLQQRSKRVTPGAVLAELSFGFWVSLFSQKYDRLYPKIAPAFSPRGPRAPIHAQLLDLSILRNRLAHHEPVFSRNLLQDMVALRHILHRLSPPMNDWLEWHEQLTVRFGTPRAVIDVF